MTFEDTIRKAVCVKIQTHDPVAKNVACLPFIRLWSLGYPKVVARSTVPFGISYLSRTFFDDNYRYYGYAAAAAWGLGHLAWDTATDWDKYGKSTEKLPPKTPNDEPTPKKPAIDPDTGERFDLDGGCCQKKWTGEKVCKVSCTRKWERDNKRAREDVELKQKALDNIADNPWSDGSQRLLPLTKNEERRIEMTKGATKSVQDQVYDSTFLSADGKIILDKPISVEGAIEAVKAINGIKTH